MRRRKAAASLVTMLGQPSWKVLTPRMEAYVTRTGGHLGPVTFDRRGRKIQPLSTAPWASETLDRRVPPILRVLRGDFFCMPFGGNDRPFGGEKFPIHGETANGRWKLEAFARQRDQTRLHLSLQTRIRAGRVDKHFAFPHDHDAIYQRHVISQMAGPMSFGHHAMIRFPDEPGSGIISTSRFVHGQVFVEPVERPENRGYSILKPGAIFDSLDRVRTITGESADVSCYPARRGFEDIVMLVADDSLPFAWTAVTFPKQRYVWFALKNPTVLRETVMWISNGGRHYAPWNGRHVNVMGLEEVTSYFHCGLAESVADNPLSRRGIATHVNLSPDAPTSINYILAVTAIPRKFDRVVDIVADRKGVTLVSASGIQVRTVVDPSCVQS